MEALRCDRLQLGNISEIVVEGEPVPCAFVRGGPQQRPAARAVEWRVRLHAVGGVDRGARVVGERGDRPLHRIDHPAAGVDEPPANGEQCAHDDPPVGQRRHRDRGGALDVGTPHQRVGHRPMQVHAARWGGAGCERLRVGGAAGDRHRGLGSRRRDDVGLDVDRHEDALVAGQPTVPRADRVDVDVELGERGPPLRERGDADRVVVVDDVEAGIVGHVSGPP